MRTKTIEMVEMVAELKMDVSLQVPADKVEELQEKLNEAVAAVMLTMITLDGDVVSPHIHAHSVGNVVVMDAE